MIIDASVALKWLVAEEGSEIALTLLDRVDLMAPTLVHSEVANGLRKKARQGELVGASSLETLAEALGEFIQTVDEVPIIGRALSIAGELKHSIYDCIYLALAEQLGQDLVTADLKFLRKVERSSYANIIRGL